MADTLTASSLLRAAGLGAREISELTAQAKYAGLSPEQYLREVVRDHLDIAREAKTKTFAELAASMRKDFAKGRMTESDLDVLADRARTRHHRRFCS